MTELPARYGAIDGWPSWGRVAATAVFLFCMGVVW